MVWNPHYEQMMQHVIVAIFFVAKAIALSSSSPSSYTASTSAFSLPGNPAVQYHPKVFTPQESNAIIQLMKEQLPAQIDDRVHKSVKRTNYFDQGNTVTCADSKYKWIFEKVLPLYYASNNNSNNDKGDDKVSMETFVSSIDFVLLHEFEGGGFFDWHVDVQPGGIGDDDNGAGTGGRTDNINVMLSERSQYEGGELTVGNSIVPAQQGDCYWYPAAFPHKVADITSGRRHTFIIAMKSSPSSSKPHSVLNRQKYWEAAEANHESICAANPFEPKLHMLHGEFLAALGRPEAEVDAKFADMYASTPEAEAYYNHFLRQGQEQLVLEKQHQQQATVGVDNKGGQEQQESSSNGYFNMANMIRARIDQKTTPRDQ